MLGVSSIAGNLFAYYAIYQGKHHCDLSGACCPVTSFDPLTVVHVPGMEQSPSEVALSSLGTGATRSHLMLTASDRPWPGLPPSSDGNILTFVGPSIARKWLEEFPVEHSRKLLISLKYYSFKGRLNR